MRIHIMGVAGTLMTSIAQLARALGHEVSGSDQGPIYPPMSTELERCQIAVQTPYSPENLKSRPDCVIIGNAIKRGNPELEYLLNENIPYVSAPQWLHDEILSKRHVIVLAGTHGKTTTTNMVTCILQKNGIDTGYLIGGVPQNLPSTASLGTAPFFVIEGDEYDTAFFDKRSKFLHYHPKTLVINNLEFDHADIFDSLAAIQKQFHQAVRIMPSQGTIIYPAHDPAIKTVLDMGVWTPQQTLGLRGSGALLEAELIQQDGSRFKVFYQDKLQGEIAWPLTGTHNVMNALSALLAALSVGIAIDAGIKTLCEFKAPKRRMEMITQAKGITIFDDFAHHPTAIETTLKGLRDKVGRAQRVIVFLEMKSYTMRSNVHGERVVEALKLADQVYILRPQEISDTELQALSKYHTDCHSYQSPQALLDAFFAQSQPGDQVIMMSNGDFQGMRETVKLKLADLYS